MKKTENIIIIGNNAKFVSEASKLIAEKTGKYYLDLADLISFDYAIEAEASYAHAESLACNRVSDFENTVICCSPGIGDNEESVLKLSQNGRVVCLHFDAKAPMAARFSELCLLCAGLSPEIIASTVVDRLHI
ncbi:MAG: hypothetical protein IJF71_02030 [Clostridia bacterium]|nr:hypothetical protein [Clostridia bacterium]